MKRTFLCRSLAFVLAVIFMVGTVSSYEPVLAYKDTYYGSPKIEEYKALSKFTEGGINYYVTKNPSGGQNGQVYVAGGTFRQESITIPAVVKHGSKYDVVGINDMAFMNFENLTKVTIEDGLTYIGGGAFWGCWYLESITLPKTLKELGESAFAKCGSLKSIAFPDSLTTIPANACEGSGITKVTLGKKVTEIKSGAFRQCMNLKEVTLPEGLKTIESSAFGECRNLGKITNNSKLKKDDYKDAFYSTKWERNEKKAESSFRAADKDLKISLSLDNKRITKGYLYYRMDDYASGAENFDYDDWELGVYTQLKTDSDGNFVLDKKYIPEGGYLIYGKFYYCESKPGNFTKDYTFMFGTADIPYAYEVGGEDAVRPVKLYNVRYEQGDHECLFLPDDTVISSKSFYSIDRNIDEFIMGVGRVQSPLAAAVALAYYADENGNRIDSIKEITEPVTLHPVFVNEDELFTGENYLAENDWQYSQFKHDREDYSKIVGNVKIKNGTELVNRFLTDYSEKRGYCIIDGKVTVSRSELKKVQDSQEKDDRNYSTIIVESGFIYNSDDFIIVKSGGTLILDGLYICNRFRISLQKGAKLQLINGTQMKGGGVITVQKGATVEINDSTAGDCIINEGKIIATAPAYKRATDSFDRESIDSSLFLNCKSGVIDLDYGSMSWGIESTSLDYGPGSLKSDMYDVDDAVAVNNGTVNVTGYGHISMEWGYQNREHRESYAKTPIVNNGTINITSSRKKFFEFSAIEIDHNSFYNFGTVKVTSDVKRSYKRAGSYAAKLAEWDGSFDAEIQVQEGEFINYGTLEFDIKNGVGMSVVESFFPRDRVVERFEEDGDAASHGRLENRAGGKITITTDNGCGIAIGRNSYLINDGSITIKDKDDTSREPSLLIGGKVINNSKITNNGSIGYTSGLMGSDLKAYALDNGYSGKKWTGSGRELLGYAMKFSGPEYYEEYNIYVNSGKTVLIDGTFYQGDSNFDTVFLPVNTKVKMTVKVSGFADKTVEYTSAASVKDYFDTAYKNLKAGSDPMYYIKVSLSKGKGTADSSITKYPMDIGDQIIIGDMYYSVTSADLKGGTVCFEHGSGMHTSLVVPDTITYEGRTYKVTMFEYAGTEVTTVTLGKNITYINENAFKFSDKLKTIKINSKLLKSGNIEYGAFEKVPASCVITVPKKKVKGYKKIFQAAGLNTKVKIKSK